MRPDLSALRERLVRLESSVRAPEAGRFPLEGPEPDPPSGAPDFSPPSLSQPGLSRGALHEVFAAGSADAAAAAGFALGLAAGAAGGLPLLWVRQDFIDGEAGWLSGQGLAAFGLDPASLVTVRARNAADMLRALAEGGRCPALGAAIGEVWGEASVLDLTATRRLSLTARGSGVTLILLRLAAAPRPSAAETRWSARAAPSRPLEANAPGPPAFSVTLLRHRAGLPGRTLTLEWDRDRRIFRTPQPRRSLAPQLPVPSLSGAVAALPAGRPLEAGEAFRRAG